LTNTIIPHGKRKRVSGLHALCILAWGLLRAYDLPVREWLKEHWLKRKAKWYFD
jgi:hypothetical protein